MAEETIGKTSPVYHLATQWLAEVAAFILLPLVVYIAVFVALGIEKTKLIELPEWMFVSIILFGESTLKSIVYYKDRLLSAAEAKREISGFSLKMTREISVGIIGIVISCVFLALSMVAFYKPDCLSLSTWFYRLQMLCFLIALGRSFVNRVYIGLKTGEGTRLTLWGFSKKPVGPPD